MLANGGRGKTAFNLTYRRNPPPAWVFALNAAYERPGQFSTCTTAACCLDAVVGAFSLQPEQRLTATEANDLASLGPSPGAFSDEVVTGSS